MTEEQIAGELLDLLTAAEDAARGLVTNVKARFLELQKLRTTSEKAIAELSSASDQPASLENRMEFIEQLRKQIAGELQALQTMTKTAALPEYAWEFVAAEDE